MKRFAALHLFRWQCVISLFVLALAAGCTSPIPRLELSPQSCGVSGALPFPVKWLVPSETGGDASRAWCAPLGPVAAGVAAPRLAAPASDVLLVNWNMAVGAGDLEALLATIVREELRAGRGKPEFVVLLQEAYRSGAAVPSTLAAGARYPRRIAHGKRRGRDIESLASRLGMHYFYAPSMRNGGIIPGEPGEDRGNAILSTLALHEAVAIELPFEQQRRVAVAARLEAAGAPLTVVSVHLDNRAPLARGFLFAGPAARHRQAAALVEALSTVRDAGRVIVAGDFNTLGGDREPAIRSVEARFARASCGRPITHQWGLALDYVFSSDPNILAGCDRRSARFDSDHHPLVARLRAKR